MRLVRFAVVQADCSISIHALTRSATPDSSKRQLRPSISIHALTRSATRHEWQQFDGWRDFNPRTHEECDRIGKKYRRNLCNFNPRTHEECDLRCTVRRVRRGDISIHALTRSATMMSCTFALLRRFQSTHSRGVRLTAFGKTAETMAFQSTHSRGVRPII